METELVPCLHFNVLNYKGMSAERRHGDTQITATGPKKCCLLCTLCLHSSCIPRQINVLHIAKRGNCLLSCFPFISIGAT